MTTNDEKSIKKLLELYERWRKKAKAFGFLKIIISFRLFVVLALLIVYSSSVLVVVVKCKFFSINILEKIKINKNICEFSVFRGLDFLF